MARAKVYKDKHGLYVRINGGIYRPVKAQYSYPVFGKNVRNDGTTSCSEGMTVKLTHVVQTPFCKVMNTVDHHEEYWQLHGSYIGTKSDKCWAPAK